MSYVIDSHILNMCDSFWYTCTETAKNEYREMIDSFRAAWTLVGHKLKNHGLLLIAIISH